MDSVAALQLHIVMLHALKCCLLARAPACSDEAEILQQLDNFQRQTATIRKALGGGGGSSGGGGLSLAVNASSGSDWGVPEGTPLWQRPTGLRGGGHTPAVTLFDGLPPSPAALAGSRMHAAAGGGYNRHVENDSSPPCSWAGQQHASHLSGSGS